MSAFFNSDGSFPLQFLIIFAVIFAVLAAIVLVFRRFSGRGMALAKSGPRGRQPRLGIVDIYELDRQRQLILLRRDNVEHLLLVGGPNDVIVERNIHRGAGARLPVDEVAKVDPLQEESAFEPARSTEPPVFQAPVFQMPDLQPPAPRSQVSKAQAYSEPNSPAAAPDLAAMPKPRGDDPEEPKTAPKPSKADIIAAKAARRNPPPLANLKAEAPDRQRPTEARSDAADEPPVPAAATPNANEVVEAPPTPVAPPVTEPARTEPPMRPQPTAKPAPMVEQVPAVPPPLARPTSSRPVDAAILSDMARQLEEALRRPSAAISPSPQAVPPKASTPLAEPKPAPRPEPVLDPMKTEKSAPDRPVDPMAAAMAEPADAEPPQAAVPPKADPSTVKPSRDEPVPSESAPDGQEKSGPEVFLPAPPSPLPAAREPASKEPLAPRRATPAAQNPFSVEEIEAEFARLLGRPLDRKG